MVNRFGSESALAMPSVWRTMREPGGNWSSRTTSAADLPAGAALDLRAGLAGTFINDVANSLGAVPETTIAPSLLFDDVGVKRATTEQQKLPYYGPPSLDSADH